MRVRIGNSSIGGRVNIKSRLPAGYQEVEYIENTSYSVLDTGILPDKKKFIIDMQYTSNASRQLMGIGGSSSEYFGNNYGTWEKIGNSDNVGTLERVAIHYDVGQIAAQRTTTWIQGSINRYYGYANNWDADVAKTFKIFVLSTTRDWYSKAKLYKLTVIDAAGNIVNQLIPCIRLSDNKPGMYDIVNNNFLVNSGTGEFIAGPNVPKGVLPDEYQRVEYIEGTGTQYIDTGIKFIKGPYKMDFKFYRNDSGINDMSIFGQRTLGKFVNTYSTYYETVFGTTTAGTLLLNQDVHMVIDSNSGIYQNGTKILNNYSNNDRSSDYSAFMFAFHENVEKTPQWFLKGRIYYYTIEEAGAVTHNFLPCYRKSDGEIGMYDVITKQFFTNQGTGTFLKGSNVVNNIGGKPHITIEGTTNLGGTSVNYSNLEYGKVYDVGGWGGDKGTITYYPNGGYNDYPYKVYHKTATGTGGFYKKTDNDIQIEAGKTYTMSVYVKASRNFSDLAYSFNINRGSDNRYITYNKSVPFTTEWKRISRTFTATEADAGMYGEMSILYDDGETDYYVYYSGFQIEEKDHATPFVIDTRPDNTII